MLNSREREDLDRKLVKDLESIFPSFIINQHSAYELPGEYAWENGGIEHSRSSISRRMQRLRRVAVDSGSAWSGSPWPLVSLGSLCVHIASGSTPRGGRAVYQDKGVIFLRSQNVHNDGLRLEGVARISLALHERKKNSHVRPLDVLLNITGASIGRSAVVPQDFEPANINQHILILRLEDSRLSEYVHKILITHPTYQDIIRLQSGSTKEGLSGEKAATLAIPMPPESRRRKLVNLLDSLSESIRVLRSVVSN